VVPTEKLEPEAGEQVGPEVTATLSVAVTSNVTAVPDRLVEVDDMSDGTVTTGGVVSEPCEKASGTNRIPTRKTPKMSGKIIFLVIFILTCVPINLILKIKLVTN